MSTDEQQTTDETGAALVLVPGTGEAIDLTAATNVLGQGLEAIDELIDQAHQARAEVAEELIRRLDRSGVRSVKGDSDDLGGYGFETNAPRTESYPAEGVEEALRKLIAEDVFDPSILDVVMPRPPAPTGPPPRKVDKAALNRLKRHDDPRVAAAIGAVRTMTPQKRTLKLTASPKTKGGQA